MTSKSLAKILLWTLVALGAGFIGGIVLAEVIGIVGVLLLHQAVGFKFLPVYTALASAFAVLVVNLVARRRS